MNVDM